MDNDYELYSELQHLWARDTDDVGALEGFILISWQMWGPFHLRIILKKLWD